MGEPLRQGGAERGHQAGHTRQSEPARLGAILRHEKLRSIEPFPKGRRDRSLGEAAVRDGL